MKKLLTAFMALSAVTAAADYVPAGTNIVTVPVGLWSNAIPYFAPGGIVTNRVDVWQGFRATDNNFKYLTNYLAMLTNTYFLTVTNGLNGTQGIQGIQGIQGLKGDTGDQGIQGIQGLKGDTGDQGIQGIQGIQGLKGDTGDQGIQGIQGIQGLPGLDGTDGLDGTNATVSFGTGYTITMNGSAQYLAYTNAGSTIDVTASGGLGSASIRFTGTGILRFPTAWGWLSTYGFYSSGGYWCTQLTNGLGFLSVVSFGDSDGEKTAKYLQP